MSALLHQKSYPTIRSTGGQEILVALPAGELGAGDGPWITSCHCSSKVCEPKGKIFGGAMQEPSAITSRRSCRNWAHRIAWKRHGWLNRRNGCEGASHTRLHELPIRKRCTHRNGFRAKTRWVAPKSPTRVRGPVQAHVPRDEY